MKTIYKIRLETLDCIEELVNVSEEDFRSYYMGRIFRKAIPPNLSGMIGLDNLCESLVEQGEREYQYQSGGSQCVTILPLKERIWKFR